MFACIFQFFKARKVTDETEAVCKRDCHNVRSYLFFNMRKFRIKISVSVCRDLKCQSCVVVICFHRVSLFGLFPVLV